MKLSLFIWLAASFAVISCNGQTEPKTDSLPLASYQILTDSAAALVKQHDTGKAMQLHKIALVHARKHALPEQEARTLMHIALLLKEQNAGQSLSYLGNALRIAEGLNKQELRADILMAISGVYKQQQNYRESLAALEAHQKLLQKLFEKNRKQEAERLREEEYQEREHAVYVTILVALAILILFFAFYYSRIRRYNKALSKSNQIKDTLFSIIGHDLRGPANGIMQALEMIGTGLLAEQEEKELIALLKKQSYSFNETLNTLLNWATAQLKGAQPQMATVSTITSIQRSLDLLQSQAAAKDLTIQFPTDHSLSVLADRDQLDFIIRNLISNAIKFSYPGGQISITSEQKASNAVIAIHDNGKGIPSHKQAELFVEGRLDSTYGTKGEKGTGLGLMLSWDFIKANRGQIWCQSKEGSGTTFYVSLPLAVQAIAP